MEPYIIFITATLIQLAYSHDKITSTSKCINDSYSSCLVSLLRPKREYVEYTRWRSNIDTTPEFIVKVLDEELTTKRIVAVNILPGTKTMQKIIIGGVVVSSPSTATTSDLSAEYTRFVPPTIAPANALNEMLLASTLSVISVPPKLYPQKGMRKQNVLPQINYASLEKHSQRDDSPPASPQFLRRTPSVARQYAPITQVKFVSRTTEAPVVTPPQRRHTFSIEEQEITYKAHPTRTTTDMEIVNLKEFLNNAITSKYSFLTRSTPKPIPDPPKRSSTALRKFYFRLSDDQISTKSNIYNYTTDGKNEGLRYTTPRSKKKSTYSSEKDTNDNNLSSSYSDEDNENNNRKSEQEYADYYAEKGNKENELFERDNESETKSNITFDELEITVKTKGSKKVTHTTKTFESVPTRVSQKPIKEKLKRQLCNLVKLRPLNFNSPRTLAEIVVQLKTWSEGSPIVKLVDITDGNLTALENPVYMVMIDDPSSGQILSAKQTIMIAAGIQGRDHHAVTAAMYVLYQLIERSEAHTDLLTKYRFWIIPVFNPDGYDYSMTFPHRREWSKNLRQMWDTCKGRNRDSCHACQAFGIRCTIQPCYGVNLDRNFEYQWIPADELRAERPCGDLYAGLRQLSELETQALTNFLDQQQIPLYIFIAFKEGEVLGIMYPYSHTKKRRAYDQVYRQRASRAASAAYSISGRPYVAGQTSEFLPLYAGGIEDWMDGHLGIDYTYTIMMYRPTDSYNTKLITERVVHEAYAAMDTLLLQSLDAIIPPKVAFASNTNSANESETLLWLFLSILLFIFS